MSDQIIALHGFLGQGKDWDAVHSATRTPLDWHCPDLFAPRGPAWTAPDLGGKAWLVGYSFGARLALRWLAQEPERWSGALLLSVNPGNFFTDAERTERRDSDHAWARVLRDLPWAELMQRWNTQEIFSADRTLERTETDFDRAKLAQAMEQFSVADQFTDPSRLFTNIVWLAGQNDTKFCRLLDHMRESGFPGNFYTVPDAGHRLLYDAPEVVASALDRMISSRNALGLDLDGPRAERFC